MRKRIVFLIDTLQRGGAETSLLEITSHFKKFEPVFIQLFKGDELKSEFDQKGIQVIQFDFDPSYRFHKVARAILPEIQRLNPLLIHSTLFRADMTARVLKKYMPVPLVNSFVNNAYSPTRYRSLSFTGKIKLRTIQQWDRLTAKKAEHFISNSETIKQSNARALAVPLDKIQVIYRGRDQSKYAGASQEKLMSLKSELNIRDKRVLLNVSRLLERKGQADLIKAFARLEGVASGQIVLLIAGEGPFRSELENIVRELQVANSVKLLGEREDIPELLQLADYFVFPSHYEGLPGALIEAMMSRKPIIASDIPENLECITPDSALLHNPADIMGIENALKVAFQNNEWDCKIEKNFDLAINRFGILNVAEQYESFYSNITELTKSN